MATPASVKGEAHKRVLREEPGRKGKQPTPAAGADRREWLAQQGDGLAGCSVGDLVHPQPPAQPRLSWLS